MRAYVHGAYYGLTSRRQKAVSVKTERLNLRLSEEARQTLERAAEVYFALGEALYLSWLMGKIEELPVESRWHAQARGSLRDELYSQHRALTAQILARGGEGSGAQLVEAWLNRDDPALKFTLGMFADMRSQVVTDYPIVSVAVRRLANLVQQGIR